MGISEYFKCVEAVISKCITSCTTVVDSSLPLLAQHRDFQFTTISPIAYL